MGRQIWLPVFFAAFAGCQTSLDSTNESALPGAATDVWSNQVAPDEQLPPVSYGALDLSIDNFRVGEWSVMTVTGAEEGESVVLLRGTDIGSTCRDAWAPLCLGIDNARMESNPMFGSMTTPVVADATGTAKFYTLMPEDSFGLRAYLQAVVWNDGADIKTSNVASETISAGAECDPDIYEPNDSASDAFEISVVAGTDFVAEDISMCGEGEDYYVLSAPAGATVDATVLFDDAEGDIDLVMYTAGGLSVTSEGLTDSETVELFTPEATDVYVYVYMWGDDGAEQVGNIYSLRARMNVDAVICEDDVLEGDSGNNSPADRVDLTSDFSTPSCDAGGWVTYTDLTACTTDAFSDGSINGQDNYAVDLDAGQSLEVAIIPGGGATEWTEADMRLQLWTLTSGGDPLLLDADVAPAADGTLEVDFTATTDITITIKVTAVEDLGLSVIGGTNYGMAIRVGDACLYDVDSRTGMQFTVTSLADYLGITGSDPTPVPLVAVSMNDASADIVLGAPAEDCNDTDTDTLNWGLDLILRPTDPDLADLLASYTPPMDCPTLIGLVGSISGDGVLDVCIAETISLGGDPISLGGLSIADVCPGTCGAVGVPSACPAGSATGVSDETTAQCVYGCAFDNSGTWVAGTGVDSIVEFQLTSYDDSAEASAWYEFQAETTAAAERITSLYAEATIIGGISSFFPPEAAPGIAALIQASFDSCGGVDTDVYDTYMPVFVPPGGYDDLPDFSMPIVDSLTLKGWDLESQLAGCDTATADAIRGMLPSGLPTLAFPGLYDIYGIPHDDGEVEATGFLGVFAIDFETGLPVEGVTIEPKLADEFCDSEEAFAGGSCNPAWLPGLSLAFTTDPVPTPGGTPATGGAFVPVSPFSVPTTMNAGILAFAHMTPGEVVFDAYDGSGDYECVPAFNPGADQFQNPSVIHAGAFTAVQVWCSRTGFSGADDSTCQDDPYENNNTPALASNLNTEVLLTCDAGDDGVPEFVTIGGLTACQEPPLSYDVYKLLVPAGYDLKVDISHDTAEGEIDVDLVFPVDPTCVSADCTFYVPDANYSSHATKTLRYHNAGSSSQMIWIRVSLETDFGSALAGGTAYSMDITRGENCFPEWDDELSSHEAEFMDLGAVLLAGGTEDEWTAIPGLAFNAQTSKTIAGVTVESAAACSPSLACINDDSTVDEFGDTCSDWYDDMGGCGNWDTADFVAGEQCCACGGGLTNPMASIMPWLASLGDDECYTSGGTIEVPGLGILSDGPNPGTARAELEPFASHELYVSQLPGHSGALAVLTGTDEVNVTYRDLHVPLSTGNGLLDYFGWYYLMISEGLIDNLELAYSDCFVGFPVSYGGCTLSNDEWVVSEAAGVRPGIGDDDFECGDDCGLVHLRMFDRDRAGGGVPPYGPFSADGIRGIAAAPYLDAAYTTPAAGFAGAYSSSLAGFIPYFAFNASEEVLPDTCGDFAGAPVDGDGWMWKSGLSSDCAPTLTDLPQMWAGDGEAIMAFALMNADADGTEVFFKTDATLDGEAVSCSVGLNTFDPPSVKIYPGSLTSVSLFCGRD